MRVKYGNFSIPSFECFVVPKGSPVMDTNLFNSFGFNVIDHMYNKVSVNQNQPFIQIQSVTAIQSTTKMTISPTVDNKNNLNYFILAKYL